MFKPKLKILVLLVLLPMWCFAQEIQVKDSAPEQYEVKQGDTLWDISNLFLDKPWLWPELWRTNSQILNPHLIYPGDILTLQWEDGRPVLTVDRPDKRVVTLSPNVNRTTKTGAIPLLPWSAIAPYLNNDMIMSEESYQRLPHLLGNSFGDIRFVNDDVVLAKATGRSSDEYVIVRKQNELFDRFGNSIGYQVRHVADAALTEAQPENEWMVRVKQSNYEAMRGDRLYAAKKQTPEDMKLVPANKRQNGQVISNLHQRDLLGKHDVVIIDLGASDIEPGTVMGIYLEGPDIYDGEEPQYDGESSLLKGAFQDGSTIKQPAIKIGELVVFKTFDKASYAIITRASEMIKNGVLVAKP
ncbi:LysM peptidoglycan-binding domain-containing protein [Alteromonas facilis]|uniref:LysM peptidoglycan-binding domain-containing protein n=1 Tax=Alteromonas facilis TaxID=2048004 RepID=UPI000C282662|nr:LysM domain-containing protein [Alteromonas facilis]